jgi:hypothetical protein
LGHDAGPFRGERDGAPETEIILKMVLSGMGLERTLIDEIFRE